MSLVLDLPVELEAALAAEAARLGLPVTEYAVRLLTHGHDARHDVRNGAELVAYWQAEGIVGTQPQIAVSAAHARHLREQAQRRGLPA
jgi:hypothetical protein